ncbi:MAG: hypothetical protein GX971_12175 [Firmicutes bacterium]|nr:hypothetical protein [Bacillota bacterium]
MTNGLDILAQTIVTGNLVLIQGLGLYALTRFTKDVKSAAQAGLNTFVGMLVGAVLLWLLDGIVPTNPTFQIGFYLVVGLVAAVAAAWILRTDSSLEQKAIDSALIGMLLLMGNDGITGVQNIWVALGAGLGYALVLVVMATIRKRLELAPVPKALRGTPILLITAGLLGLALLGFRF